ncbi:MAG: hypothetical protein AB2777_20700 [Candidatus Thiodiazotropha endolucinida]
MPAAHLKNQPIHIKFIDWDCILSWKSYGNGRPALELLHAETGEPIARASINLVNEPMADDEIAINHDFRDELLSCLTQAEIIYPPHRYVTPPGSFVEFAIVTVRPEARPWLAA